MVIGRACEVDIIARTLDQILADLNPAYDPQRALVQKQQDALPAQFDAQQQGLQAQADSANQGILSQAQQRGLGFSGIPVAEQAKYNATTFMPAVANLKGQQLQAQTSLSDQLNKLNTDQRTQAMGYQQDEYNRDQQAAQLAEQQRQFNLNLQFQKDQAARQAATARASAGSGGVSLGGGGGAAAQPSLNQAIAQAFSKYSVAAAKSAPGYAEKVIQQLAGDYGNPQLVAQQVYAYRKAAFGV